MLRERVQESRRKEAPVNGRLSCNRDSLRTQINLRKGFPQRNPEGKKRKTLDGNCLGREVRRSSKGRSGTDNPWPPWNRNCGKGKRDRKNSIDELSLNLPQDKKVLCNRLQWRSEQRVPSEAEETKHTHATQTMPRVYAWGKGSESLRRTLKMSRIDQLEIFLGYGKAIVSHFLDKFWQQQRNREGNEIRQTSPELSQEKLRDPTKPPLAFLKGKFIIQFDFFRSLAPDKVQREEKVPQRSEYPGVQTEVLAASVKGFLESLNQGECDQGRAQER